MLVEITKAEADILLNALLNSTVQISLGTMLSGETKIDPLIIGAVGKLRTVINHNEREITMSEEVQTPEVEETPVAPEVEVVEEGSGAPESTEAAPSPEATVEEAPTV